MKRKVELFIQEGKVTKLAEPYSTANHYGQIEVTNFANAPDPGTVTVYTHYDHSFPKDENGKPIQPPVTGDNGPAVYFFLIPMEYLFSGNDLAGDIDDTPLLAVNVIDTFPYLESFNNNPKNRHPCTTALTVEPDPKGNSAYSILAMNFLIVPVLSIRFFLNTFFHKNRRYFYGINDYGEITIIETKTLEDAGKIKPYTKIWLEAKNNIHAHFRRIYSPKLKGDKRDEFKILMQSFKRIDDQWVWKFQEKEQ